MSKSCVFLVVLVYFELNNSSGNHTPSIINIIMNCDKCFNKMIKEYCLNCSVYKMLYNFYCQSYNQSKLFCLDCKLGFESGISTNKKNITLQSLDESVNCMSNKCDDFNT